MKGGSSGTALSFPFPFADADAEDTLPAAAAVFFEAADVLAAAVFFGLVSAFFPRSR